MLRRLRLPEIEPLTTYRLISALGAVALFTAGLVNPSDATAVAITRYLAIVCMVSLVTLSYLSPAVRRHVGWGACLVNTMVVVYLCAMLYVTRLAPDSLIASFVGVLICGMVLHRVRLVVAFMSTAAALHVATAYVVVDPVIEPMSVTVNTLLYVLFVGTMLSMQLTARERRRNSESLMQAIFDQSSDALIYGDPEASDVQRVNPRAMQLFETDDLNFIAGQIRKGFLAVHTADELPAVIDQARLDPSWGEICEFTTASGRRFHGNLAMRRLAAPYDNVVVARVTDMSQQMEREAALEKAKEDAESAARTRSQFLANMSHEIRTPMNGVIGMTSLLLKTPLDEEQQRYVDIVRTSGESLLTIINEILDFSKLEAHQVRLEHERFDVEELAVEALNTVSLQANQKGLELVLRMLPGQHRFFLGDAPRLRQVLVNLLSNAVKFTSHGEVTMGVDVVPRADDRAELHFEVRDTGIGIAPADAERLFEPFVQADASTTRRYGGTGLGLSISKSLVELMGGEISLTSEPDVGSTFRFHVVADAAPARRRMEGAALRGLRAAVIQSHAPTGEVLGAMLRAAGLEVAQYTAPGPFLDDFRDGACQVVLADLQGPGVSGSELVGALSSAGRGGPFVVLLAPLQSRESFDDHGVAVLRKPVRPSELLTTLEQGLGLLGDDASGESRKPDDRPDFSRLTVLVAEDNTINRQVVRQMLRNLHIRADFVADGQAALEALERQTYDMVLMDLQMPVMDGMEATRLIRDRYGDGVYIAAMTASAMASDREACLAAGMDDFISKPVRMDDLERPLRTVLSRHLANGAPGVRGAG